jgi:predicted transcriptional regulator
VLYEPAWFSAESFEVTAAFTVRIDDETAAALDKLGKRMDRSRTYLAARAIEDYVALQAWQVEEIEAGIADADAGNFATEDEVSKVLAEFSDPSA